LQIKLLHFFLVLVVVLVLETPARIRGRFKGQKWFLDACNGQNSLAWIFAERVSGLEAALVRNAPFPLTPPSPSGRGWHAHRLSSKPAAGLVKVAFEGHGGDKTCSFSPREKVRMRGKVARYF
jgi:hypothetical protein